jgi:hypothetical protein
MATNMKETLPGQKQYYQGHYEPRNPGKYRGALPIRYLSQWELAVMRLLDLHPAVVLWSSESLQVPYVNALTGKPSVYYPDFMVVYQDKEGKKHQEILEIKPASQTYPDMAVSKRDRQALIVNICKWKGMQEWCSKNNFTFRVLTEFEIFGRALTKTARAGTRSTPGTRPKGPRKPRSFGPNIGRATKR